VGESDRLVELEQENARLRVELEYARRDLGSARQTIVGLPEIVITVASGGALAYMNDAAERQFGIKRDVVMGVPLKVLSSPTMKGSELQGIVERASREGSATDELTSGRKTWEVRALRGATSPCSC